MKCLSTSHVFQNAWVVEDFEAAITYWSKNLGVGPFFLLDFQSGSGFTYRGGPGVLAMRVAWAQAGDVQIELIEPLSVEPNVYRDLVPRGVTRFHHVCLWSTDVDADKQIMAQAGFPTVMESGPGGTRFAYFDTSEFNGHMVEILERGAGIVAAFDRIKIAAADWDGKDPLRRFEDLNLPRTTDHTQSRDDFASPV